MSRLFGKVASTIWNSQRFNRLSGPLPRLAYVYLHTNTHGNSSGAYRLPPAYLAADMRIETTEAEAVLAEMSQIGLIDYDRDEQVVVIEGWWPHNQIMNRKHLQSVINVLHGLPRGTRFRPRVAFLASASTIERARTWVTDTKGAEAAQDALTMCSKMLRSVINEAPDSAISDAENTLSETLLIEVSEALSIPCERFSFRDRDRDRDSYTDSIHRQRQETETSAAPSKTVQEEVEDLNKRAAGSLQ